MENNNWDFTDEELKEICGIYNNLNKYTIYATYRLFLNNTNETLHSSNIKKKYVEKDENNTLHLYFNSDGFNFLNNGYTADKITILVQLVENIETEDGYRTAPPKSNKWKEIDVTNQINGGVINKVNLLESNIFVSIPSLEYFEDSENVFYDLSYLDYPQKNENKLVFGDEMFFFGNISSGIEAITHSTDLPIKLPMNEFNTSINKTWTDDSSVYITEIGIYDDEDNLVGIAKPTYPIEKNSQISRTIIFSLDF